MQWVRICVSVLSNLNTFAMTNSSSIGIAIIGAGRAGMIHACNFAVAVPGARVVALADPFEATLTASAERLGSVETFTDYRDAIACKGVDAVLIATPTTSHLEIASAAAAAGKHVFCEKPMAMNVAECDAMLNAAKDAGIVLQIGFMRRFSQSFRLAKSRIDNGDIGEVVQVRSQTHGPSFPKPWMFEMEKSNGPLAEVNSHDIDTVRWLAGGEFEEVYALAANYRMDEARKTHPDFYDQVLMTARISGGRQGCVSGAQGVQYAYDARCEVIGTHGMLSIGSLRGDDVVVCTKDKELRRPSIDSWTTLFEEAYLSEDIDFIECIRTGRKPRAGGRDGRAAVAAVIAGNQSIREMKPIQL